MEKTNGHANGNGANGANGASGANGEYDPFAKGVWIITPALGHPNVLAMIHGTDAPGGITEEQLQKEFVESGGIGVTLLRKYVLADIQFPLHERTPNGGNGRVVPNRIAAFSTHETLIDLEHPFETDVILHAVTWVSRMHPENVARLRKTVKGIDESTERQKRMARSNLVMPNVGF